MSWGALPASIMLDLAKKNGAYYQLELDLDCPPWVFVKPEYLTSVTNGFNVITGNGGSSGLSGTEDHPRFRDTREWLAQNEYIYKETKWLNGDRVTKPFYFNNVFMDVGTQFSCASAMGHSEYIENYNEGEPLPVSNASDREYAKDVITGYDWW